MRLLGLPLLLAMILAAGVQHASAQARIIGPSDVVVVVISDWDLNGNPLGVDRYDDPEFVLFRTSRDEVGEAHPEIVETGASTGLFEFRIELETDVLACRLDRLDDKRFEATGGSDPSVGACPGDVLMVRYEDNMGAGGRPEVVDYIFEVRSWNPEFTGDQPSYSAGERVTVEIYDLDANRNPDVSDSLRDVRVFSESDPAGQQFSAIETGRNTGVFRLSFMTSSEVQGNAILVRGVEEVTVLYTDDYPEDFSQFQEEKQFSFVMIIGDNPGEGSLTPSSPVVIAGSTAETISTGQQVTLSTQISSSFTMAAFPFVAMMEVRDSAGVTVALGWQASRIQPQGQTEVGMSWIPDFHGEFEVRTFLISDLQNPQILSQVASSAVTVSP